MTTPIRFMYTDRDSFFILVVRYSYAARLAGQRALPPPLRRCGNPLLFGQENRRSACPAPLYTSIQTSQKFPPCLPGIWMRTSHFPSAPRKILSSPGRKSTPSNTAPAPQAGTGAKPEEWNWRRIGPCSTSQLARLAPTRVPGERSSSLECKVGASRFRRDRMRQRGMPGCGHP